MSTQPADMGAALLLCAAVAGCSDGVISTSVVAVVMQECRAHDGVLNFTQPYGMAADGTGRYGEVDVMCRDGTKVTLHFRR